MNKSPKLLLLLAGFGILFVHSTVAGPFERFRERLAEFKRQRNPPAAPVAPVAPSSPEYNVVFNNTIWTGVINISAKSFSQFKQNQKQNYEIISPIVSAPVELWFPTETTWLLVLDFSPLKVSGSSQSVAGGDANWGELIGSAPKNALEELYSEGLLIRPAVLYGYDGEGTLVKGNDGKAGTFSGNRDKKNRPEGFVACSGSYRFSGAVNNPAMVVNGLATTQNQSEDGFRLDGNANYEIKVTKSIGRTVSGDINKRGGFLSVQWWGYDLLEGRITPTPAVAPPF